MIRKRITKGYTREAREVEYILTYLYDRTLWSSGGTRADAVSITTGDCYDDEVEFISDFAELFKDRFKNFGAARRAVIKRLKQMVSDNWLEQKRRYNDKHYVGEMRSGWYPCYAMYEEDIYKIKKGRTSIKELVERYCGVQLESITNAV